MKKMVIAFCMVLGLLFFPNLKVDASSINSGYSSYWSEGYRVPNSQHVGHSYKTGVWWDGVVRNKTWTYVDIQMSNYFSVEFVNILTTPFPNLPYTNQMALTYVYLQEFTQITKSSFYTYIELDDAYQYDADLFTIYSENKSHNGFQISRQVDYDLYGNVLDDGHYIGARTGFEYSLALYELNLDVYYNEVYRYEIGSWWNKSIRQEVSNRLEKGLVSYVLIPVRIDENYKTEDYFFLKSGINKRCF